MNQEFILKNGKKIIIREPNENDAQGLIDLCNQVDGESMFLAREIGEFQFSVDKEKELINNISNADGQIWFVAEYEGRIIGQASLSRVRNLTRFNHRAQFGVMVSKDFWGVGVGSKLLNECILWAMRNKFEQIELYVIDKNERAINMYKKFGFKEYGRVPNEMKYKDGTYIDAIYMVKEL